MNPPVNTFRKLSGIAWLVVLACSIGYTTRYGLLREESLSVEVQNVAPEVTLANEPTVNSRTSEEQFAAQALAIAETAKTKTLR